MIVIHPTDPTTDCLKPVYSRIKDAKVFTDYRDRNAMIEAIRSAPLDETICMLGHGTPEGLLYRHWDGMSLLFDDDDAWILERRPNIVGIWCHASEYAASHHLDGLYSGMFISELMEAFMCGVEAEPEEIALENIRFSEMLGDCLANGLSLEQTAERLSLPENIHSQLTEYNYSRIRFFSGNASSYSEERLTLTDRNVIRNALGGVDLDEEHPDITILNSLRSLLPAVAEALGLSLSEKPLFQVRKEMNQGEKEAVTMVMPNSEWQISSLGRIGIKTKDGGDELSGFFSYPEDGMEDIMEWTDKLLPEFIAGIRGRLRKMVKDRLRAAIAMSGHEDVRSNPETVIFPGTSLTVPWNEINSLEAGSADWKSTYMVTTFLKDRISEVRYGDDDIPLMCMGSDGPVLWIEDLGGELPLRACKDSNEGALFLEWFLAFYQVCEYGTIL